MSRLFMIKGPMQGRAFQINAPMTSIGRAPDNDIQIDDPSISRKHANIILKGDSIFIEDLKSQNGTLINGQAIAPFEPHTLHQGLSIAMGNIIFILGETTSVPGPATSFAIDLSEQIGDRKVVQPHEQTVITDRKNLELIYEVSSTLLRSLDITEICEKIMNALFFHFSRIDAGFILLLERETHELNEIIARERDRKKRPDLNYSRTVVDRVLREGKAVMISDTGTEQKKAFSGSVEMHRIRSIMCVPLVSQSEIRGVIYVHSILMPQGFQKKDLSLFAALSSPAAVAIENALLFQKTKQAEEALRNARGELEKRVAERTRELVVANKKLTNEITERKRSVAALRESEEKFRNMASSAQDAIIATDNEGRVSYWNKAAESMFGYSEEEVIGKDVHSLIAPNRYEETIRRGFAGWKTSGLGAAVEKTRELTALKKDGSQFPVELSLSSVKVRGQWTAIGMVRDITARKEAGAELEKQAYELNVRVKQLYCLYGISRIQEEQPDIPLGGLLQRVADLIPPAMERPETACARILFDNRDYNSPNFSEGEWKMDRPIIANGREVGMIEVFYRHKEEQTPQAGVFSREEGTLLNVIAEQLGKTIEHKRIREALGRAREREVEIGSRIQQTLLLGTPPQNVPGLGVSAMTIPSQRIDGDFYDFFRQSDQSMDILIGDVMGKGVPAALLGAAIKSHFVKALSDLIPVSKTFPTPAEIVGEVHKRMVGELIDLESFVTLCYVRFDLVGRRGECIDCGHTRTIHFHKAAQNCSTVKGYNMPLGFTEKETYSPLSFPLEAGDILFFYSDGITEARNGAGEFFGEQRLLECIKTHGLLEPEGLIRQVRSDVTAFSNTESFSDDLTCIAVKILAESNLTPVLHLELEMTSDTEQLSKLRDFVQDLCQRNIHPPLDMDNTWQLGLAANEAVTNIIRHAYGGLNNGKIHIVAEAFVDRIVLCFNHWGKAFEPPRSVSPPPVEDYHESGYGLFLIQSYVDDVNYARDPDGKNSIYLVKNRKSA